MLRGIRLCIAAVAVNGLTLCLAQVVGGSPAGTASVAGRIIGTNGAPLAGAQAYYVRQSEWARGSDLRWRMVRPSLDGVQTTDNSGNYQISGLQGGDYYLCAAYPAGGYLDICRWSGRPTITVGDGASVTGQNFQLQAGAQVVIHVRDPVELLPTLPETPSSPPTLIVGVKLPSGAFYPAIATKSQAGRDYTIIVPFDTALHVAVFSNKFRVKDQNGWESRDGEGVDIPAEGALVPFHASNGAAAPEFTFQVIRALPPQAGTLP